MFLQVQPKDNIEVVFAPNVITPNGDGVNDQLCLNVKGATDYSITVKNRFGSTVYLNTGAVVSNMVCVWGGMCNTGLFCQNTCVSDGDYFIVINLSNCDHSLSEPLNVEVLNATACTGRHANPDNSGTKTKGGVAGQQQSNISHQSQNNNSQTAAQSEISNLKSEIFHLYPNPTSGTMQMDYRLQENETGELVVYDITGRRIKRYLLTTQNNTLKIQDSELKNGVYFYQVIVNNEMMASEKLVVIK